MKKDVVSGLSVTNNYRQGSDEEKKAVNKVLPFTAEMLDIINILNCRKYKALILYLLPEHKHPKKELIQLLSEMASHDYLCFICSPESDPNDFKGTETLGQNLFFLHQGYSIIPIFRNLSAIILSTEDIHPDWSEVLQHKFLWFHAGLTSELNSPDITANIFKTADLISYFPANKKGEVKLLSDPRSLTLNPSKENQYNSLLVEQRLKSNPKGWRAFANLNLQGKVAVMTATFFDFEGEFFYSGGAERYLLDLAEIFEELGQELVVFQYGNNSWMRHVKNINVIALSKAGLRAEGWIVQCAKAFNQIFYEQVQGRTNLNIYSAFFEAWPLAATPNIGISHGVAWDNPFCTFDNALEFWLMNDRHIQGAKACEELVSVDSNTANWFQTVDFDLGQKTKVIPNYVDLSKFKPRKGYLEKREKTVVLYPRQFYSGRGLDLVLEIIDDILEKYPEVEFHFVGRGGEEAITLINEKQKNWPGRVKCYSQSMDEMPQVYQDADIALIPTVHSEGTSLSCLEAMASGNGVIATRIGGLSDLIINNYNGLLIDPQPVELKAALIKLLEDQEQLVSFKKRSLEVAKAFSKTLWQDRWKSLITKKLAAVSNKSPAQLQKSRVVELKLSDRVIDFGKLGEKVTALLNEGCLVHIRSKAIPDHSLSFARLQWLAPDTPLFSPCDLTIEW